MSIRDEKLGRSFYLWISIGEQITNERAESAYLRGYRVGAVSKELTYDIHSMGKNCTLWEEGKTQRKRENRKSTEKEFVRG